MSTVAFPAIFGLIEIAQNYFERPFPESEISRIRDLSSG